MFAITQSAVKSITVSKRTSADEFLKNLSIDKNGKVQVFNRYCQNPHTVTLNRYHKCSRGQAFFKWGFTSWKAEQPLRGMELQEKNKKVKAYKKSV